MIMSVYTDSETCAGKTRAVDDVCRHHESRNHLNALRLLAALGEFTTSSIFHYQAKVGRSKYDPFEPNDVWMTEFQNASYLFLHSRCGLSGCFGVPGPELDGNL